MMSSYNMCQTLGALPDPGGLRDQAADFVEFAMEFHNAEVTHLRSK